MEGISLEKLNREGILIEFVKKNAFIRKGSRMPYMYHQGDPSTCYLHYYKDMYYVTHHITTTMQLQYYEFDEAQNKFAEIVECIKD